MLYKYIQLSRDIERFLKRWRVQGFTRSAIRRNISLSQGFYKYSDTTLNSAIKWLELTGKVIEEPERLDGSLYYTYLKSDNYISKNKKGYGNENPS